MQLWEQFEFWISDLSLGSILARMLIAILAGTLLGIDRRDKNKGAGVRTHSMVCVGSALTMVTSQYVAIRFPEAGGDVFRLGAGVVSGVGFLGAGTIIVGDRNKVHGLTTAAGLWTCACIGLAIGCGFIGGTIVAMLAAFIILHNLTPLDRRLRRHARAFDLYIEFADVESAREFTHILDEQGIAYTDFVLQDSPIAGEGPVATVSVELDSYQRKKEYLKELKDADGISYFEIA